MFGGLGFLLNGNLAVSVGRSSPVDTSEPIRRQICVIGGTDIVGCGRSHFGRPILVAYEIKRPAEFCFGVFLPKLGTLFVGECKVQDEAWTAFRCPRLPRLQERFEVPRWMRQGPALSDFSLNQGLSA
jgi:hypothetical protein